MARGIALPDACATLSCLFLMMASRVSSSYSSLPYDADGTVMILLGLGRGAGSVVAKVFTWGVEDFVSELVAAGSEELELAVVGFTTFFCTGFGGGAEDFGVDAIGAEGFGADGFGVDGFGTEGFAAEGFGAEGFVTEACADFS